MGVVHRNRPPAGWHRHPTLCILYPQPSDSRGQDHLSHETLGLQGQPGMLLPPLCSVSLSLSCPLPRPRLSLFCCSKQHLPPILPVVWLIHLPRHASLSPWDTSVVYEPLPSIWTVWLPGASHSTLSSKSSTTTQMPSFHQSSLLAKVTGPHGQRVTQRQGSP